MILSIITINYNNFDGLKKTINSVVSQTWRNFEWIIIDGGSTDGSKEVVEELAKNSLANVSYWCSEPDGGIYQALNKGVKFAQGEYVSFMNAGDAFHNDKVLEGVFEKNPKADILYGDAVFVSLERRWKKTYPQELSLSWLYKCDTINHQSSFTRRSVFDKLSFDTKYHFLADRKFWMECVLNGYSFYYIPIIISDYDFTGYSSQNIDKFGNELEAIYKELIYPTIRCDLENSFRFQTIPYLEDMEHVSDYGAGTKMVYIALNKLFFRIMRVRLFNVFFNAVFKCMNN